jgi:shikimate kinase
MKLLVIYGPPAAGKLTVAKEVAKRTGYKLFHNHLTVDLYEMVMPFDTNDFWDRVRNLRLEIFGLAAKYDVNLIFTVCYEHPEDAGLIDMIVKTVEDQKQEVCFVHLACQKDELLNRVVSESRKQYGKLKDPVIMKEETTNKDFYTQIEHQNSISIDNTHKSPEEVAELIIKKFKL